MVPVTFKTFQTKSPRYNKIIQRQKHPLKRCDANGIEAALMRKLWPPDFSLAGFFTIWAGCIALIAPAPQAERNGAKTVETQPSPGTVDAFPARHCHPG